MVPDKDLLAIELTNKKNALEIRNSLLNVMAELDLKKQEIHALAHKVSSSNDQIMLANLQKEQKDLSLALLDMEKKLVDLANVDEEYLNCLEKIAVFLFQSDQSKFAYLMDSKNQIQTTYETIEAFDNIICQINEVLMLIETQWHIITQVPASSLYFFSGGGALNIGLNLTALGFDNHQYDHVVSRLQSVLNKLQKDCLQLGWPFKQNINLNLPLYDKNFRGSPENRMKAIQSAIVQKNAELTRSKNRLQETYLIAKEEFELDVLSSWNKYPSQ